MRTNQINAFLASQATKTATLALKPETVEFMPWDAPISVEKLVTVSGIETGRFAIVARAESGLARVVGSYAKGDTLLRNMDAVEATEAALAKCGFTWTREIRVCRDGGGLEMIYTITNYPITIGHSQGMPQVRLRNSYDGVWKFSGSFSVLMLVCLNGLMTTKEVAYLGAKHSSKLNISEIAGRFAGLIESGVASAKSFEALEQYAIADDFAAARLFGNLSRLSKGGISKRNAAEMLSYYLNPDEPESSLSPSLWRAYMAATRMVRDLSTVRPTVAGEVNPWLGNIFGLVVDRGGDHFGDTKYLFQDPGSFAVLEAELA